MTVADTVCEIESAGAAFLLENDKVRVWYPDDDRRKELAEQVALLRVQRAEVAAYLKTRNEIPSMPQGVRLIRWEPKIAPVALTKVEVVTDVPRFIAMTLLELKAALEGKPYLSGHRTVRDLVDRLEECGVMVACLMADRGSYRWSWWSSAGK